MIKIDHIIFIILIIVTFLIIKKISNDKFTEPESPIVITESIKNLSLITSQLLDTTNPLETKVTVPSDLIIKEELYINDKKMETIEPGTIISYCLDDIPDGWVECDGKWYLLSKYFNESLKKTLYIDPSNKSISYKYIKSPDLRDRFILSYNYDINDTTTLNQYGGDDKIKVKHIPEHKHYYYERKYFKPNESVYNLRVLEDGTRDGNGDIVTAIIPTPSKSILKKDITADLNDYNKMTSNFFVDSFEDKEKYLKTSHNINTKVKDMFLPNEVNNYYPPYCVLKYIMKI
jgi:hypothetical protein